MKITKITKLEAGIYAFVCPACGSILASASDPEFMPDYSTCDCETNIEADDFELFKVDDKTMIRRTKYPRFIGEITFGQTSDIENIEMIDECTNLAELAQIMKKAGEYLIKSNQKWQDLVV